MKLPCQSYYLWQILCTFGPKFLNEIGETIFLCKIFIKVIKVRLPAMWSCLGVQSFATQLANYHLTGSRLFHD